MTRLIPFEDDVIMAHVQGLVVEENYKVDGDGETPEFVSDATRLLLSHWLGRKFVTPTVKDGN